MYPVLSFTNWAISGGDGQPPVTTASPTSQQSDSGLHRKVFEEQMRVLEQQQAQELLSCLVA